MATESPIRMRRKWQSHGKVTVPNRSGSAPPNMEGSFLAIDNIFPQQNLGFSNKLPSFHGDMENPFYRAYYCSKLNLNPRHPCVDMKENQFLQDNAGGFRNRNNSGLTNSSNPIHMSQGALSTHKEVPEEDSSPQQSEHDVSGRTNRFLSGQETCPLPGGQQFSAALRQEDASHDPISVHNRSNSSNYEREMTVDKDALVESSDHFNTSVVKDNTVLLPGSNTSLKTELSVGSEKILDIFTLASTMKNASISNPPNPENKNLGKQKQVNHQQQNNQARNQSVKSQTTSHVVVNSSYAGTGQSLQGPPSKFSADVQPVLHSSGFTPPLYGTNSMSYIASPNPVYNVQPSSVYSPQYGFSGYPLSLNIVPQFFPGCSLQGAIPFAVGPNFIPQPSDLPSGGNVLDGSKMQYFDKLYGRARHPSLVDPLYLKYYQQPSRQADNMPSQISLQAHRSVFPGGQKNPIELQKDELKMPRPTSGPSNPNLGNCGIVVPNYCGTLPNMGILVNYPTSQIRTPILPGPSQFVSLYSGTPSQRGLESSNSPRLCNFLEELKSGKGRRFELSDIAGHIVVFSADQHGSRFIQQKLENCSFEEKASVLKEILPHACKLTTDVFGNYVIQKFFEYGNSTQRKELADQLRGQILLLSLQMYGCRVIQKALDVIDPEQKARLIQELDGHIMRCVRDQNGNHVIQKCIERIPSDKIGFIISAFRGQVASLSMHPYGCRVIQRVLEHCSDDSQCRFIIDEILESACALSKDQYGNYVAQHVLESGTAQERERIVRNLSGHIVQLSQHKFASNVIEKCLEYGGVMERELMINEVVGHSEGNDNLLTMMKDQFGNYVVQKIFEACTDDQMAMLLSRIRVYASVLKKYTYGKHIVARLEQLFGEDSEASG